MPSFELLTIEQMKRLRQCSAGDALIVAFNELLERDHYLLIRDANERSITFRFAMYLQSQLPGWDIDCEFNRDGFIPKQLRYIPLKPESDDEEAKTVFPDVIAHKRGTPDNLLVIEFKKSTSQVDFAIDIAKLKGYKQQLGYRYALFVLVGTGGQARIVDIQWIN